VVTGPSLYKDLMWITGLIGGALLTAAAVSAAALVTPPEPARRVELIHLVQQDCGSCHGLTLKGGLGPALTPEALAGKSPDGLRATILYGRPGTPMAPWRSFLTEQEAGWVVEVLMQGRLDAEK
jgi:cytochrome c55X